MGIKAARHKRLNILQDVEKISDRQIRLQSLTTSIRRLYTKIIKKTPI